MIVCHCKVVNDAALVAAVDAGARSVAAACRVTGAATDCGGCVFAVKRVLGDCLAHPEVAHQEAEIAAS